jgi:hypothetical protein
LLDVLGTVLVVFALYLFRRERVVVNDRGHIVDMKVAVTGASLKSRSSAVVVLLVGVAVLLVPRALPSYFTAKLPISGKVMLHDGKAVTPLRNAVVAVVPMASYAMMTLADGTYRLVPGVYPLLEPEPRAQTLRYRSRTFRRGREGLLRPHVHGEHEMKRAVSVTVVLLLVLVLFWSAHAESLKLVQGTLLDNAGAPLVNQTVVIEGWAENAVFDALPFLAFPRRHVKVLAVTDKRGSLQIVDLPAGKYTMKMLGADGWLKPIRDLPLERGYKTKSFTEKLNLSENLSIQKSPASTSAP